MKKALKLVGLVVLLIVIAGAALFAIYVYPVMSSMKKTTTIAYDKNLTLVLGGGGNSGILVGDSVALVIDTKMEDAAEKLARTVKTLAGNKPIIVVNTHIHSDHTGGNKYFKGQTIIAGGNYDKDVWVKEDGVESTPTVWLKDSMTIKVGDEIVTIINLPWPAHTQSDVFVYLQNRKMLFTGDVVLNQSAPAMFSKYNSDPEGYLRAFDWSENRFDIAQVVPGHGLNGGKEVIDNYRIFFNEAKAAANDAGKEREFVEKYKDYRQIPMIMSPAATVKSFKK